MFLLEPLNVGDIVEVHSLDGNLARYNGTTGEVTTPLREIFISGEFKFTGYRVLFPDCSDVYISAICLFKHSPIVSRNDLDTKVSWDKCAWQPTHLRKTT